MTDPIIVPAEISDAAPKENVLKKIIHDPKLLITGAGVALALVAGAVWFAVKRMDEDDFDETFPEELATTSADDTTV